MELKDMKYEWCGCCQRNVLVNDPERPHLCDKPVSELTLGELTNNVVEAIERRFRTIVTD